MKYIETNPKNIESFKETFLMFVKEIYENSNYKTKYENIIEQKKRKKKESQCIIFKWNFI